MKLLRCVQEYSQSLSKDKEQQAVEEEFQTYKSTLMLQSRPLQLDVRMGRAREARRPPGGA